ncbi:MAG: hypothetical protein H8D78_02705 [Chloroflexi bacterium]|nr:hypothetical protein [Chloroflexota bacterium]
MTDLDPSVDSLLAELKASLSQAGGEAALRRINAERLLRLLADEFVESRQAERIRILPDHRLAGEPGADFLLQIDDYDIRLLFLDAPGGEPILDAEQLPEFLSLLEDNPSTVALVLVWTTDDLQAVSLSVLRIRYLSQNPDRLNALLAEASPLPETLRTLVERQTKLWEAGLDKAPHTAAKATDMRRLFEEAIGDAIETERGRSYRYAERKLAARQFPVEEEKHLIFSVLGEALAGASAMELVPRLTRLSQRGR